MRPPFSFTGEGLSVTAHRWLDGGWADAGAGSDQPSVAGVMLKQIVHFSSDAIAQVVTDDAHVVEPDHEGVAVRFRKLTCNLESLFEHADQSTEVAFILVAKLVAEISSIFAIENHQLGEPGWIANRLAVIGNGLLGLGNRRILVAQYIRVEPALQRLFVGLQNVAAQAKAGVKKGLVVFLKSIEILDQAQEP